MGGGVEEEQGAEAVSYILDKCPSHCALGISSLFGEGQNVRTCRQGGIHRATVIHSQKAAHCTCSVVMWTHTCPLHRKRVLKLSVSAKNGSYTVGCHLGMFSEIGFCPRCLRTGF